MRIAYLDCFAGISGDMFLGALLEAGVPAQVFHDAIAALNLGARLEIETVDRSGISCTKVHVLEDDRTAEKPEQIQPHTHPEAPAAFEHQKPQESTPHTHQPKTQHEHKTGHPHSHAHGEEHGHNHIHGRSLSVIRDLIQAAPLNEAVKKTAIHAFELLGHSEAKIHNVPVEDIHFHEVGAVDAIVDIVAVSAGIHHLQIQTWYCSPLNIGGGMVVCAHGTFPVPAPATADLLRGVPTYSAHVQKELVTPTGAALLRALNPIFGQQPAMRVEQIGYGAGTRNPKDFPNVLRIHIGEAVDTSDIAHSPISTSHAGESVNTESAPHGKHIYRESETVVVLETALDDLSPQILAYVAETALAQGALDVMLTPVIMKKGRPGTLLTILCNPSESSSLQRLILQETSTLGIRIRQDRRTCLERSHKTVQTIYGDIRVKIGSLGDEVVNAAPEFEDCRVAAIQHNVPLKEVQRSAIAVFWR
jgi:uncharacterized protein (TIGR00299 family) protein